MVSCKLLFLTLVAGSEVFAASGAKCTTRLGPSSCQVNRHTSTQTTTITKKIVRTVGNTVTPEPVTSTIQSTLTTTITIEARTKTNTATVTQTTTSTKTSVMTIPEIATKNSYTYSGTRTATSTVPAPPDFTYLADDRNYKPRIKGRDGAINKRELVKEKQYPQRIDCNEIVTKTTTKTVTSMAKGSATTLPTPTTVKTATVTHEETTTVYPEASTTITITSKFSTSTLIIKTSTSTVTSLIGVETGVAKPYYQGCGARNLVDKGNDGYPMSYVSNLNRNASLILGVGSAYDCCAICFETYICWDSAYNLATSECVLGLGDRCIPGEYNGNWFRTSTDLTMDHLVVSNGPCGRLNNGGGWL